MTDQTVQAPAAEVIADVPAADVPAAVAPAAETAVAATDDKDAEKAKILKQVEFYFSDANLPTDKFMSELVGKNGGCKWIQTNV